MSARLQRLSFAGRPLLGPSASVRALATTPKASISSQRQLKAQEAVAVSQNDLPVLSSKAGSFSSVRASDPIAPVESRIEVERVWQERNEIGTRLPGLIYAQARQILPTTAQQSQSVQLPLSPRFLRDHCQCSECVDPITKQRNVDVLTDTDQFLKAQIEDNGDSFQVNWNDGKHHSAYSKAWLGQSLNPAEIMRRVQAIPSQPVLWHQPEHISVNPPAVDFDAVMASSSSSGLGQWTDQIRRHGFCFVENTPVTEADTEALITRIGPLVNTHYGLFHTMTSDLSSKDSAYTEVALPPHNDTTYFTTPIGLQMLHLLEHSTSAAGDSPTGGESILVDGFLAAEIMRREHPSKFDVLSSIKIIAHASGNDGIILQGAFAEPVIKIDDVTGQVAQIRWNNADRHALIIPKAEGTGAHQSLTDQWYDAAATWNEIIETDARCRYEFRLEPGKPVMFDNWRVLHARNSFKGKRRMCGGYVDRDYFISTWKATNQK